MMTVECVAACQFDASRRWRALKNSLSSDPEPLLDLLPTTLSPSLSPCSHTPPAYFALTHHPPPALSPPNRNKKNKNTALDPLRPRDQAFPGRTDTLFHHLGTRRQQDRSETLQLVLARRSAQLQAPPNPGPFPGGPVVRRPLRPGLHLAVQRLLPDHHRVHQHAFSVHFELRDGRVRKQDERRPKDLWPFGVEGVPRLRAELSGAADDDRQVRVHRLRKLFGVLVAVVSFFVYVFFGAEFFSPTFTRSLSLSLSLSRPAA